MFFLFHIMYSTIEKYAIAEPPTTVIISVTVALDIEGVVFGMVESVIAVTSSKTRVDDRLGISVVVTIVEVLEVLILVDIDVAALGGPVDLGAVSVTL